MLILKNDMTFLYVYNVNILKVYYCIGLIVTITNN